MTLEELGGNIREGAEWLYSLSSKLQQELEHASKTPTVTHCNECNKDVVLVEKPFVPWLKTTCPVCALYELGRILISIDHRLRRGEIKKAFAIVVGCGELSYHIFTGDISVPQDLIDGADGVIEEIVDGSCDWYDHDDEDQKDLRRLQAMMKLSK
jgi:phage FluMu protein Com